MRDVKWPLQLIATMLISTFVADTTVKTVVLLIFWLATFYPIRSRELLFFITCCFCFTVSNYGALKNNVFEFRHQDILLMPYNELLMWGFYCLNAFRLLDRWPVAVKSFKKFLIHAVPFAGSFSIIKDEVSLAACLLALLILGLSFFHGKRNFLFVGYFLLMGILVEGLGIGFQLWHYPHAQYFEFPLWAPLMWTNIGLIISQVSVHFFKKEQHAEFGQAA